VEENMNFSNIANYFQPNIFNILDERMKEAAKQGMQIYNFSVGTPDFKPAKHVMDAVVKAAAAPENYKYSLGDTVQLKEAVIRWYKKRYDVDIAADEITSVNGSQGGLAHIALTVCNHGDYVLVPNPGYPIFEIGPYLNGAKIVYYPLDKNNHCMPMLSDISEETARQAKMMVVSYPLNPTCTCADRAFYERLVAFAKKYDILIVHDNAYSEIVYDGRKGFSFLSIPGAKEVGVEFNSLSKTYNLTGLRISFCIGNKDVVTKFKTIWSQFDYGMSFIAQKAAIAALDGPQDGVRAQCMAYQRRRDALCGGLNKIGWEVPYSEGTMFVWAPVPKGFQNSDDFCIALLENTGIVCTPGSAFGSEGKNNVRFALVLDEVQIAQAVEKIGQFLIDM